MKFRDSLTYDLSYSLKPNLDLIGDGIDELFESTEEYNYEDFRMLDRSSKVNYCLEKLLGYTSFILYTVPTDGEDLIFALGYINDMILLTTFNKYYTISSSLSSVKQSVLRNTVVLRNADGLLKYLKARKSIIADLKEDDKIKLLSPFKEDISEDTLKHFLEDTVIKKGLKNRYDLENITAEGTNELMRKALHVKVDLELNGEQKFFGLRGEAKGKLKELFNKSTKTKNLEFDLKNVSSVLHLRPSVVCHLLELDELDEFFNHSIAFYLAPKKQKRGRKPKAEVKGNGVSASLTTNPLE